jgi:uncharacterized protein YggU (UPF0235/DUF167 family)
MKTNQEIVQLLTSEFNVNKVWDFIESKPFYNKSYMPMFSTAEEIWKEWSAQDKSLYAKFKWKDKYGGKLHPREIEARKKQGKINKFESMKTNKEIIALLSDEVNLAKQKVTLGEQEQRISSIIKTINKAYGFSGNFDAVFFLANYMKKMGYLSNFSMGINKGE